MKHVYWVLVASLCLVGAAAAEKIPAGAGVFSPETDCLTEGYEPLVGEGGGVPDCNLDGVRFGPVPTADDGTVVTDVILGLDISHSWIGDLWVALLYDTDCDGTPEHQGGVLCRMEMPGCPLDGCCGCSGNLQGIYLFDDAAPSIEAIACPGTFLPGCYGPDADSPGLDVFDNLESGGCFWLKVVDGSCLDLGTVNAWAVYLHTQDISPVEASTWSRIKAGYR
jgi:hypothetical protein